MKKTAVKTDDDDMLPEYDFSRGVRGKYAARYQRGTNVVVLEPTWPGNLPAPPT